MILGTLQAISFVSASLRPLWRLLQVMNLSTKLMTLESLQWARIYSTLSFS